MLLSLPMQHWPPRYRLAWSTITSPADSLYAPGYQASTWRPATCEAYAEVCGLWLSYLAREHAALFTAPVAVAVTPAVVDGWVRDQRSRGNANGTIRRRLGAIHTLTAMLAPDANVSFILRPAGISLRRLFPDTPNHVPVEDVADLWIRVVALYEAGLRGEAYAGGCAAIRDAALLGVLVTRAPRIGSIARMRLGQHLHRGEDGYRVVFGADDTKTHHRLAYPFFPGLTPILDTYLETVRPTFGGDLSAMVWMGTRQRPLAAQHLGKIVRRRTADWFDQARGPHWFRKCLTTSSATRSPEHLLDATVIQGHSPETSLKHYNQARGAAAAGRYAEDVTRLRQATEGLAARSFAGEAPGA